MARPKLPPSAQKVQWCLQVPRTLAEEYGATFIELHTGKYRYEFRNELLASLLRFALESFRSGEKLADFTPIHNLMWRELNADPTATPTSPVATNGDDSVNP